jgi:biotin---protein ligase
METARVNVLIYSGRGVSPSALSHTTTCLRALLLPQYSVRDIATSALISEPWSRTCALLVFPGGRDKPYHEDLEHACETIRQYVQDGGACLSFCAGAYFMSRRVEWEVGSSNQVIGDRALGFFPGTCEGCVYPGFSYDDETGARTIALEVESGNGASPRIIEGIYYNGGGHFVDAEKMEGQGVTPLARYIDGEGAGKVAAVACVIGKGKAVLWGAHPEYSLLLHPTVASLDKSPRHYSASQRTAMETERWKVMRETLRHLALRLPPMEPLFPPESSILPQHLTSAPWKSHLVPETLKILSLPWPTPESVAVLEDFNDTFRFRLSSHSVSTYDASGTDKSSPSPKDIIVYDGELPPLRETPLFDLQRYYSYLSDMASQPSVTRGGLLKMGELLLYGERVTSTQTMLDK